jgi:hypothetical protein
MSVNQQTVGLNKKHILATNIGFQEEKQQYIGQPNFLHRNSSPDSRFPLTFVQNKH